MPITSSIWTKVKVLDFNAYVEQLPASQINDGIEVGDIRGLDLMLSWE